MTVKDQLEINPKVSIIIPLYNTKSLLKQTIDSVLAQTYTDWEIIVVDDCSTDGSFEHAQFLAEKDSRIKVYKMDQNSGPGSATKFGFEKSSGGLVAFIDSDDLWAPDKLSKQITFMEENNYEFTCTDYEQINEDGESIHRVIKCKDKAAYKTVLKTCPVGSSTVILTASLLRQVDIPTIRKNNDYTLWLRLLKIYPCIYGMHETLMYYRVWSQSISYNKFKKVKYFWIAYREYEDFSILKSLFLLMEWTVIKVLRIK